MFQGDISGLCFRVTFPEILNLNQFVWDDAPGDSKDEAGENRDPASMSDDSGGGASGGGTTGLTTGNSHRGGTVNGHCSTEHGSTASGPTTQIAVDHLEDGKFAEFTGPITVGFWFHKFYIKSTLEKHACCFES